MSRILLVCPEPLGHGHPAGIGIRFIEIARVLREDGHDVTVLSPDGGPVEGCNTAPISPEALLHGSEKSDVLVVQGHAANDVFAHARPIPTVVDLYDPYIIENLNYFESRGAEVYTHDHATLMQSLLRGDLFLCASEAQRLFYLGALLAVGRLNPLAYRADPSLENLVRIAPFGVHPPRAVAPRDTHDLLFGGIYDWYDPVLAIDAVAAARREIPDVTLTFSTHPNPDLTPQGRHAEALAHAKRVHATDFIRFEPWTAYGRRSEFFDRFGGAVMTFGDSLETQLAMRTRIYDYLWAGLPVITSSAPGTDELLEQHTAGVVIRDNAVESFTNAIVDFFRNADMRAALVDGTQRFVATHQWRDTLAPLLAFCRKPAVDPSKVRFAVANPIPPQPRSILQRVKRRLGVAR